MAQEVKNLVLSQLAQVAALGGFNLWPKKFCMPLCMMGVDSKMKIIKTQLSYYFFFPLEHSLEISLQK